MKRESFGSGRVRSGERRSLPYSTQASLFFRFAQTIAPFTVHFVLLAELLEQAVLLLIITYYSFSKNLLKTLAKIIGYW